MSNKQSELIKQMSDKEVLIQLYFTQLIMLIIAVILGFFLFDNFDSFGQLWEWNVKEIIYVGGGLAFIVIVIDSFFMKVLPEKMYDDGGINERVFQKRSFWHIVIISLVVSFSEEILFRGVIQSQFGLIIASVIFALLHIRYLNKLFLFIVVVLLSFFIGYVFEITKNLWVVIFAHFLIDTVFAMIIRVKYIKSKEVKEIKI